MTVIERAARALCTLDGHPPDAKMDGGPLWKDYLPEVKAVMEAIMEPSKTMCEVGANWLTGDKGPRAKAQAVWREMVRAAVEEQ